MIIVVPSSKEIRVDLIPKRIGVKQSLIVLLIVAVSTFVNYHTAFLIIGILIDGYIFTALIDALVT